MELPLSRLLLSVVLAAVLLVEVQAQTTSSGGLNGVVTDQTGALMPSTQVVIKDIAKGAKQTTNTDGQGAYRFSFLLPGRYELTVSRDGFRKQTRLVEVFLGPAVTVNIFLALAAASTEN